MIVAPLVAFLFSIMLFVLDRQTLLVALPLLISWIASPYLATRISEPYRQPVTKIIPAQEHKLRMLARSTWLYFEHFVGPEDRWLPPDHFQESPRGMVAHRTSPTNIGLMLLSTLSAHDLGYIGPLELSLRLRDSFDSMDSLERADISELARPRLLRRFHRAVSAEIGCGDLRRVAAWEACAKPVRWQC
jgi:cyclic beta-1,2-glucan synthetase